MIIAMASDHGGYVLKAKIKEYLKEQGIDIIDLGTDNDDSVDYPVFGQVCGDAVAGGVADRGIVCCGTGIGISIAANKVKGIRCALCTNEYMAEMSRKHNDANMLALGGRVLEPDEALQITKVWLETEFEGGRHQRRVNLLNNM